MQPATHRAAWALGLLLLCGGLCTPAAGVAPPRRRSFGFRVQSRDAAAAGPGAAPTFRRSLLRNATMPLHGAVKDFGCAGWAVDGGGSWVLLCGTLVPLQADEPSAACSRLPPPAATSTPRCTWEPLPRSLL